MPRENMSYGTAGSVTLIHQHFNSIDAFQNYSFPAATTAIVVSVIGAAGTFAAASFDGTVPSATNGLQLPAGPPIFIPLGYHSHPGHTMSIIGLTAGLAADVLALS